MKFKAKTFSHPDGKWLSIVLASMALPLVVQAQPLNTVLLAQAPAPASAAVPEERAAMRLDDTKGAKVAKKWSVYWGWNRSNYSDSDIHFHGEGHDFTLSNVRATDKQSPVNLEYLNPLGFTGPQTNFRVAYQFEPDMAVAFNLDHMKYHVVADQTVPISGQINNIPQSGTKVLSPDQLEYEHCDGLNILSLELEKQYPLNWFGANRQSKTFVLAGAGLVVPRSGISLGLVSGREPSHQFHLAGFSYAVGAGVEVTVWEDVFVRTAFKVGHVNLPDVLTSAQGDRASQQFDYRELLIAVGIRF